MSQMRAGARTLVLATVLGLLLTGPALAAKTRTEVVVSDDWPADSSLDPPTISCPGGDLEWVDPVTPVCPGSGRIHLRGGIGYGCDQAQVVGGGAEPRLTGVVLFEFNANLDADYSGSAWGTWKTVPGACDPSRLYDPDAPHWKGIWVGQRLRFCDATGCRWIGELKVVGKGHGDSLEGLHFRGTETVTTFTPLPVPWDLIGLCPPCGPEGVLTGTIKE